MICKLYNRPEVIFSLVINISLRQSKMICKLYNRPEVIFSLVFNTRCRSRKMKIRVTRFARSNQLTKFVIFLTANFSHFSGNSPIQTTKSDQNIKGSRHSLRLLR
jgi:hypothetical protein